MREPIKPGWRLKMLLLDLPITGRFQGNEALIGYFIKCRHCGKTGLFPKDLEERIKEDAVREFIGSDEFHDVAVAQGYVDEYTHPGPY